MAAADDGKSIATSSFSSPPNARGCGRSGSSAGGFGALYNFDRIEKRFESKTVFLIDDSGPPMGDMWLTPCLQTQMRTSWKLSETLPEDCAACTSQGRPSSKITRPM